MKNAMAYLQYGAKAIYAGLVAGLGALVAVLADGSSLSEITGAAWVTIGLATLLAVGGVFRLNNAPKPS